MLEVHTENGRVEIDNNAAENSILPTPIDKKRLGRERRREACGGAFRLYGASRTPPPLAGSVTERFIGG